jgi:hypothetical protein
MVVMLITDGVIDVTFAWVITDGAMNLVCNSS